MVDYYFMYGPDLDTVVGDYRQATGAAPMFPQWAYGLFQSKDHYGSQAELQGVRRRLPRQTTFRWTSWCRTGSNWKPEPVGLPCDGSAQIFPDPKAMIKPSACRERPFDDLGVGRSSIPARPNYNQLNSAGCFYRDARDGSTYGNYYDTYSAQWPVAVTGRRSASKLFDKLRLGRVLARCQRVGGTGRVSAPT